MFFFYSKFINKKNNSCFISLMAIEGWLMWIAVNYDKEKNNEEMMT